MKMNYTDQTKNPARQALNRAVNRAIADGSPVFVNQPAPCYVCQGICLGHDPIEAGDVFESTSGNIWQVVAVKDREFGQCAEVFATMKPADHYCWSVDSLRMMRRLEPNAPKPPEVF
jgi:hypothetical protein